ncbi:MAG: hypothetical protein C4545_04040 [Anaerolineaceae bacterium]|jgi:hypothetical protein|nr:MAG: hypothetical protein C4545_04040 [Anaerolineaceae bacterium]
MKIKRSEFKTFLNISATGTADYALLGDGVTSASINYNPQTTEETYIHQDSGVTEVESYRPTMPVEATAIAGDEVFDYVDGIRQNRAVLDAAKTDIVNVWLYETPTLNEYPAEKQNVSIQIDEFGGEGGASAKINFTINFIGDPVKGTFNPTTREFTPGS